MLENVSKQTGQVSFSWFFMSPVKEKYISYSNLFDGTLTLFDIYKMNEALNYISDFRENLHNTLNPEVK